MQEGVALARQPAPVAKDLENGHGAREPAAATTPPPLHRPSPLNIRRLEAGMGPSSVCGLLPHRARSRAAFMCPHFLRQGPAVPPHHRAHARAEGSAGDRGRLVGPHRSVDSSLTLLCRTLMCNETRGRTGDPGCIPVFSPTILYRCTACMRSTCCQACTLHAAITAPQRSASQVGDRARRQGHRVWHVSAMWAEQTPRASAQARAELWEGAVPPCPPGPAPQAFLHAQSTCDEELHKSALRLLTPTPRCNTPLSPAGLSAYAHIHGEGNSGTIGHGGAESSNGRWDHQMEPCFGAQDTRSATRGSDPGTADTLYRAGMEKGQCDSAVRAGGEWAASGEVSLCTPADRAGRSGQGGRGRTCAGCTWSWNRPRSPGQPGVRGGRRRGEVSMYRTDALLRGLWQETTGSGGHGCLRLGGGPSESDGFPGDGEGTSRLFRRWGCAEGAGASGGVCGGSHGSAQGSGDGRVSARLRQERAWTGAPVPASQPAQELVGAAAGVP